MSSEAEALAYPPGLGVAPAISPSKNAKPAQADAPIEDQSGIIKEPRVFPRRRPDLTDAEAERREALRAHPPPSSGENAV